MPAAEGNKYAEKWTKEATLDKLALILEHSESDDTFYIGDALSKVGLYAQWYSDMATKFTDDDQVSETIKRIDQAFEAKLVTETLKGKLNPTMAIFTLKNKHKWKDKTEQEIRYPEGVKVNYVAQPGNEPLEDVE